MPAIFLTGDFGNYADVARLGLVPALTAAIVLGVIIGAVHGALIGCKIG